MYVEQFGNAKEEEKTTLREKYHLSDKPIIIYVGRLDKEKRVDVLVKAAALLKNKDFQLIIAGKGVEKEKIRKLVKRLHITDNVVFLGYLPDGELPVLYTLATLYVMPSGAELQSLSTMEAMASGLPVIGANAIALPNLIKDGMNGFLFEPGNEEDLADKITRILADKTLRQHMAQESKKLVQEHNMPNVITKMEKVYEKLLER